MVIRENQKVYTGKSAGGCVSNMTYNSIKSNEKPKMNIVGLVLLEIYMYLAFFSGRIPWFGHAIILLVCIVNVLVVNRFAKKRFMFLVVFLVAQFVYYFKYSFALNDYIIQAFAIVAVTLMTGVYDQIGYHSKTIIVRFAIICNLITQLITIYYASTDSEIVRNIMHGEASGLGIATFTNIYVYLIYCFPLYYVFKNSIGRRKTIFALLLAVNIITIFVASFLTAIIIFFVIIIVLIVESSVSIAKKRLLISLAIISSILLVIFASPILQFILNHFHLGLSMKTRIQEILFFIQTGTSSSSSDLTSRMVAYSTSFKTFIHNIPFGRLIPFNSSYTAIGGHSKVFDTLANYGLISIFYFSFLHECYKNGKEFVELRNRSFYKACWIAYLIISLSNPTDDSYFVLMLGIVIIAFLDIYSPREEVDQ